MDLDTFTKCAKGLQFALLASLRDAGFGAVVRGYRPKLLNHRLIFGNPPGCAVRAPLRLWHLNHEEPLKDGKVHGVGDLEISNPVK